MGELSNELRSESFGTRRKVIRELLQLLEGLQLDVGVPVELSPAPRLAAPRVTISDALDDWTGSQARFADLEVVRRALLVRVRELRDFSRNSSVEVNEWFDSPRRDLEFEDLAGIYERALWKYEGSAFAMGTFVRAARQRLWGELGFDDKVLMLRRSENASRVVGFLGSAAADLYRRGTLYFNNEHVREASRAYDEYVASYPDASGAFRVQLQRAEIVRQQDRYRDALAMLDELEATSGDVDIIKRLRLAELRGMILLDLGLIDLAGAVLRPAIAEARNWYAGLERPSSSDGLTFIRMQARAADLALSMGDFELAAREIQGILEDTTPYDPWPRMLTHMLLNQGAVLNELELRDPEREPRAADTIRAALARDDVRDRDRIDGELTLARIYVRLGELDEATLVLDRVGGRLSDWKARQSSSEVFTETLEWVVWRASVALRRGDDRTVHAGLLTEAEVALEGMLESWSAVEDRSAGVGFLHYNQRRLLVGELIELCDAALGPELGARRAMEWLVRVQAHGTLFRRSGLATPDLEACRALLSGAEHGVLAYLPTSTGTRLLIFDQDGVEYVPVAPLHVIHDVRVEYVRLLSSGPEPSVAQQARERELAHELAGLLLPPDVLARIESWQRISVMGLDHLGVVPFACLPAFGSEHLGAVRAVDYMPSFPVGALVATGIAEGSGQEAPSVDLLLVADTRPGADYAELPHLPFPGAVRDRIVAAYAPDRVRVLHGSGATPRHLERAGLGSTRTFQPLVHSVADFRRERPMGLALSGQTQDDGILWCDDVERFDAPRFVLLASCRSGRSRTRRGDAVAGDLAGAWLAAGAQSVLVSHFELGYRDAIDLSSRMHARIAADRVAPAEALRAVRAELGAEMGAEAPFRIGLLEVVGLGHASLYDATEPESDVQAGSNGRGARSSALLGPLAGLLLGAAGGFVLGTRRRRA
ncbi:MAG: CHAT domain-containing protein [bacterium]|nr:CHAT domain-containing protein [bacterium]